MRFYQLAVADGNQNYVLDNYSQLELEFKPLSVPIIITIIVIITIVVLIIIIIFLKIITIIVSVLLALV